MGGNETLFVRPGHILQMVALTVFQDIPITTSYAITIV